MLDRCHEIEKYNKKIFNKLAEIWSRPNTYFTDGKPQTKVFTRKKTKKGGSKAGPLQEAYSYREVTLDSHRGNVSKDLRPTSREKSLINTSSNKKPLLKTLKQQLPSLRKSRSFDSRDNKKEDKIEDTFEYPAASTIFLKKKTIDDEDFVIEIRRTAKNFFIVATNTMKPLRYYGRLSIEEGSRIIQLLNYDYHELVNRVVVKNEVLTIEKLQYNPELSSGKEIIAVEKPKSPEKTTNPFNLTMRDQNISLESQQGAYYRRISEPMKERKNGQVSASTNGDATQTGLNRKRSSIIEEERKKLRTAGEEGGGQQQNQNETIN